LNVKTLKNIAKNKSNPGCLVRARCDKSYFNFLAISILPLPLLCIFSLRLDANSKAHEQDAEIEKKRKEQLMTEAIGEVQVKTLNTTLTSTVTLTLMEVEFLERRHHHRGCQEEVIQVKKSAVHTSRGVTNKAQDTATVFTENDKKMERSRHTKTRTKIVQGKNCIDDTALYRADLYLGLGKASSGARNSDMDSRKPAYVSQVIKLSPSVDEVLLLQPMQPLEEA